MYYLGVDGGGTKTKFVLINGKERTLTQLTKESCYYIQIQFEGFRKVIQEGISEICANNQITIGDIDYSFLGLPAYGEIEKDIPRLEAIVKDILKNNKFKCGNDVEAGWAGSLACQPGINLVAGTGAIGFGRDYLGNMARTSGWGYFCGDEGSAYWLGKQLISVFSKEADGRENRTPLYDIVRQEFHLARDFDLISVLYDTLKLKRDAIAKLARLVFSAAGQGDPKALELYDQAAFEHSLIVKSLLRQLQFDGDAEIKVSYSGGVFNAGGLILNPLKKYLEEYPIRLIKPVLQPGTGAALYAMQLDGQVVSEQLVDALNKQEKKMIS